MLNVVRDQVHVRSLPLSDFCALAFLLRCPWTNEAVCERVGLCGGWNVVVGWWWLVRGGWFVVAGAPRCLKVFFFRSRASRACSYPMPTGDTEYSPVPPTLVEDLACVGFGSQGWPSAASALCFAITIAGAVLSSALRAAMS